MKDFKLYCFGESGNSYKAALMLQFCELEWDAIKVDFFNGETRSKQYRENINELGEAPVLVHGEQNFSQSGVILQYLSDQTGKFGGGNKAEKYEILKWILFDNHKFTNYIATHRFMLAFMKTGETEVVKFMAGRIRSALHIVDNHLTGRKFMATENLSIADVSMCGYLYYGDELGFDLAPFENINAWLERIKATDGWKAPYDLMPAGIKS